MQKRLQASLKWQSEAKVEQEIATIRTAEAQQEAEQLSQQLEAAEADVISLRSSTSKAQQANASAVARAEIIALELASLQARRQQCFCFQK